MPIKVTPGTEIESHFLLPGEFFFGDSKCHVHTVLGSCIAITLWHPRLKIGGMCHFVLPDSMGKSTTAKPDGRYLDGAITLFEKAVAAHGTNLTQYHAKIFGGSNMIERSSANKNILIGEKNTTAATELLYKKGITIYVAHVGETGHRRIVFDISTGDVWVRHEPLEKFIINNER